MTVRFLHTHQSEPPMNTRPHTDWYRYDNGNAVVPVLTRDGIAHPAMLTSAEQTLAALAVAIHASAWQLSEAQLRTLEQFVAIQRWTR